MACFNTTRSAWTGGSLVCLPRGTHLVIVGDSQLRYLYLTLAYAVHFGVLFSPASDLEGAGQLYHTSKGLDWQVFYRNTTALFGGYEGCDCHRSSNSTDCCSVVAPIMENRYYHDPATDLRLTYLQCFGNGHDRALRGVFWPGDDPGRARPHSTYDPRWRLTLTEAIQELIPQLAPTVVLLNLGHHKKVPTNASEFAELFGAVHRSVPYAQAWWLSTPSCYTHMNWLCRAAIMNANESALAEPAGFHVIDARAMTRKLPRVDYLTDGLHLSHRPNNIIASALASEIAAAGVPHIPAHVAYKRRA